MFPVNLAFSSSNTRQEHKKNKTQSSKFKNNLLDSSRYEESDEKDYIEVSANTGERVLILKLKLKDLMESEKPLPKDNLNFSNIMILNENKKPHSFEKICLNGQRSYRANTLNQRALLQFISPDEEIRISV